MASELDWMSIEQRLVARGFPASDDIACWRTIIETIAVDAAYLARMSNARRPIVLRFVRSSHWLRPHQCRWTADGGFAAPLGYASTPYSRNGTPYVDEDAPFCVVEWDADQSRWAALSSRSLKRRRRLILTSYIPGRTARHRQAAVLARWRPGSPMDPKTEATLFYGFRKSERDEWMHTAVLDQQCLMSDRLRERPDSESAR